LLKLLLFINKLFRPRKHPFNEKGSHKLNYAKFEYESAKTVFKDFEMLISKKVKDLVKGKVILDLACGAGGKSLYLKENGAKYVKGIDVSKILIKQANSFKKDKKNIEFVVGDVCNLPFPDSSFGILIANDLMEHVSNPEKMISESYRVLKKGGKLLINFEPYYHFLGHHMWDVIHIPWAHLLFSEKTRIEAYKILVSVYNDAQERISFRINRNHNGKEYIGYLNHMTHNRFRQIIHNSDFVVQKKKIIYIKEAFSLLFRIIPYIRELFIRRCIYILIKK